MVRQYQAQSLLEYSLLRFKELGDTYVSRVIGMDVVFTCDPENIKHILQRRFDDFDIGPLRRHLFTPVNPDGIFGFDGAEWRARRKLFRVHFADTRTVVDLDTIEMHLQEMVLRIPSHGAGVDIQQLFVALMTDTLGTLAVGEPMHALLTERSNYENKVDKALFFVKSRIARFGMSKPLSWLSDEMRFRSAGAIVRAYTEKFVRQAMDQNTLLEKQGETDEKIFRRSFVHGSIYDGHSLSTVRDQASSIYLAGIESVAALLSATFWYLSQDQRVFQTLRGCILERFGSEDKPGYDDLNTIPYLRSIFNEGRQVS
jgi:cytochrome P450